MDIPSVIDRFLGTIRQRLDLRVELEPAAELTADPLIVVRHLPPAIRRSRVNDDGSGLLWFREVSLVVMLAAHGSGGKAMRRNLSGASDKLAALFDNDEGGGDFPINDEATWYAAFEGVRQGGQNPLSPDPELEGSFTWNESWDVKLYVPEAALA